MQAARGEVTPHKCPDCDKPLAYRWGKTGRFLACTGYPACKFTCNVDREGNPVVRTTNTPCQRCGKPMILRSSRGKPFLGCSGYPACNFTMPCDETGTPLRKVKPEEIKETCDECSSPMAVKFKGRNAFLGCTNYPSCRGTKQLPAGVYVEAPPKAPAEPAGLNCPECGKPMVIREGKRGPFVACTGYPKCHKTIPLERLEEARAGAAGKKAAKAGSEDAEASAAGGDAEGAETAGATAVANTSKSKSGKLVVESLDAPVNCPECGSRMQLRPGRWGPFMACSAYPRCKGTARLKGEALAQAKEQVPTPAPKPKAEPTDIACPECGSKMVIRMSRRGRFLGCGGYPKCRHTMEMPADLAEQVRKRLDAEAKGQ
jgi:DNA topoisomerase-1